MKHLIKGGTLVTENKSFPADILIEGEKIVQIAPNLETDGAKVTDASGKLIFPGFIDTHTHFDLQGACATADDFATGTKAAIVGGTTMVLDFATQDRGMTSLAALEKWHNKAEGRSSCDYGFHMSYTEWNETLRKELPEMIREGITSFKLYMAYDNLMVDDDTIREVLKQINNYQGLAGVHCEVGKMVSQGIKRELELGHKEPKYHPVSRPPIVEAEAVKRCLAAARLADAPVNIVHLSTELGLREVQKAREKGQRVYVETCPQYLLLDDSVYDTPESFEGSKYVLSPPLRKQGDIECLWKAMGNGQIDTIGTDHCSFNYKNDKEIGRKDFSKIPNGIPGVEHRPPLIYSFGVVKERITLNQMVSLLSTNPAKLFGLYPNKGSLAVGADGDIVIWDPECDYEIKADEQLQNVDYTPYEGIKVKGRAWSVFLRGEKVVENSKMILERQGKYIKRGKSITL